MILDTNVMSELMDRRPNPRVVAWCDAQRRDRLVTTSISVLELHTGFRLMRAGRRRSDLSRKVDWAIDEFLGGRVLSFDRRAAVVAAEIYASRRAAGRTIDLRDTMIAGISLSRRIPIATRNVAHFDDLDVKTVDPWSH